MNRYLLFLLLTLFGSITFGQQQLERAEKALVSNIKRLLNNKELSESLQLIYWRNDSIPMLQEINSTVGLIYQEYQIPVVETFSYSMPSLTVYQLSDLIQIKNYLNESSIDPSLNNKDLFYLLRFSEDSFKILSIGEQKEITLDVYIGGVENNKGYIKKYKSYDLNLE